MMKRRILYTGYFSFPEGSAASARVMGIGYALREAGYVVDFVPAIAPDCDPAWADGWREHDFPATATRWAPAP